jgi:GMP synthase (glutamine-hydrolysing)
VKVLVFQHVAHEILGTLNPLLKDAGFRIRYVNFGRHPHARPEIDRYHGLVVLGGPMNVDQVEQHPHLHTELELIERAMQRGMPILGVCLGAQLVAKALGAEVRPSPQKEIGWYPVSPTRQALDDPLLGHFGPCEQIFQWHGDSFELPRGAVHLASSPGCPNQAFRYEDNVYGFQFHMEVDEHLIERWLTIPHHQRELSELKGEDGPDQIRRVTPENMPRLSQLAERTFREFVKLFGHRIVFRQLPSR